MAIADRRPSAFRLPLFDLSANAIIPPGCVNKTRRRVGHYRIHLHFTRQSTILTSLLADVGHLRGAHRARMHTQAPSPRGDDVDGVGHNVRIRKEMLRHSFRHRSGGASGATPFFAYTSSPSAARSNAPRHLKVQSEERFLNLEA